MEQAGNPICQEHHVPMRSLNIAFGNMPPNLKWFCPRCGEEATNAQAKEAQRRSAYEKQTQINTRLSNAMIAPRFREKTFENFLIENDRQAKALAQAKRFLKSPHKSVGMIFTGRPGTGKNHLACATAKNLLAAGKTAYVTTVFKLIREIKSSWVDGSEKKIIQGFLDPDLLVIDEIGVQFGSDTEKLYLTEIINDRYEWLKPTILMSNLNIEELKQGVLGDRIVDRFREGGELVVFDWESYRGRSKTVNE